MGLPDEVACGQHTVSIATSPLADACAGAKIKAMHRSAEFSPCRTWRYALWRTWDSSAPYAMFIGLNPSTADEIENDPTVTRCIGYSRTWGYGGLCMTNLFAYRDTDPRGMKAAPDPIGPDNDEWLDRLARAAGVVVAAWGTHGVHQGRDCVVRARLTGVLHYLKLTKFGHPQHPLYLRADLKPTCWVV
jgi:hypothetical protein